MSGYFSTLAPGKRLEHIKLNNVVEDHLRLHRNFGTVLRTPFVMCELNKTRNHI